MLYIRGRELSDVQEHQGELSIRRSIEVLKRAIELDPEFASAYAEIANSTFLLVAGNHMPLEEGELEARKWIDRALAIDPNNARAFSALGFINAFKFCRVSPEDEYFSAAKENLERSIEINPNDHRVRQHYGMLHYCTKPDLEIYFREQKIAIQLAPLSYLANSNYMNALVSNGMLDEAAALNEDKKFLFSEESFRNYDWNALLSSWQAKDWTKGLEVWQEAVKENPKNLNYQIQLALMHISVRQDPEEYLRILKNTYYMDSKKTSSGYSDNSAYMYGMSLVETGDFDTLDKLFEEPQFLASVDHDYQIFLRAMTFYLNGEYQKAIDESLKFKNELIKISAPGIKYISYYKLGNKKEANRILNEDMVDGWKITAFSLVEERDSMYHYLEQINRMDSAQATFAALWWTLWKYKEEPRFKAFLEKHYLPIIE